MKKSGLAESPFFAAPAPKKPPPSPPPASGGPGKGKAKQKTVRPAGKTSGNHDTTGPRNHDATLPRYHDTIVETIRQAVKQLGKEAATYRFTREEKQALADIIYAYRGRGLRTSENQIARVGVNFIVEDYKASGKKSVLARVLKALEE